MKENKKKEVVIAVCSIFDGPAKGHQVLRLGQRVYSSDPRGWTVSEPIRSLVVPSGGYDLKTKTEQLPDSAIPAEEFFQK